MNGGETGYTSVRDIDGHKRAVSDASVEELALLLRREQVAVATGVQNGGQIFIGQKANDTSLTFLNGFGKDRDGSSKQFVSSEE